MRTLSLLLGMTLIAACSSPPRTVQRPQVPPPGPSLNREAEAFERQQAMSVDDEASQAFLEQEIERNKPPDPPPQPVVETVRYVQQPVYNENYPSYYGSVRSYHGDHYTSPFPWNTAVGAGVGAIIGHQSGHRGRGAAVGAGVGLLLDLARWHW